MNATWTRNPSSEESRPQQMSHGMVRNSKSVDGLNPRRNSIDKGQTSTNVTWGRLTRNTKSSDALGVGGQRKSSQETTKTHRNLSWCGLSSESKGMKGMNDSTSNASWSTVDEDAPRRGGLRRMGSNRLLGMVTGGSTAETDSIGSRSPQSVSRGVRRQASGRMRRKSFTGLNKQMSKRTLVCECDDEDDKNDANKSIRKIELLFEHEPSMGKEEVAEKIRTLMEANAEEAVRCSRAIKQQLDVAMARQLTGNNIGAVIAMKKMKRIETEQKKYMKVIDYLRAEEINMALLEGQKDQDHSAEWTSMFKALTQGVEAILSRFGQEKQWSNEALLDELMRSTKEDDQETTTPSSKSSKDSSVVKEPMMTMIGNLVVDDPAEESANR